MHLQNDLLLRAARGEQCERPPVWVMRQAGRILPEYREVRASVAGFKELVTNPELCCEVTLQPVDLLGVDAAIIFSDILVIPEAMGLPYEMIEKRGPLFPSTVQNAADLKRLTMDVEEPLEYVRRALEITSRELAGRVPLIGFAGAPWTIFAYMTEGSGSKTFSKARKLLYTDPSFSEQLLNMITTATIRYLKMQIKAGAQLVQIFDSWAGILPPDQYRAHSLKYISRICDEINEVPVTVFAKGAWFALSEMKDLNCETVGLDWHTDPRWARAQVGDAKTLQGNMDPCALYAEDETIVSKTHEMLQSFGSRRHIVNLGHGVYPDTEARKVKLFIETVKNYQYPKS
ncbi:MAG: uroporphyrinogen decarboxylase [Cryomorphaceae bacterium]|nr:MAG: uroporphyrinogen decarboxylase [Cryomorphaceae bacterium]